MARASRVLTLAVTLAFAAFALAADQDCPTKPSETPLEFAPVAKACGADQGDKFCSSCVCSLVDTYMPAFIAANLTATATEFPVEKAAGIITACTTTYYPSLEAAKVNVTQVAALGNSAAPALRVATVAAGPNGPSVTLAGQLNSVADLAAAMAASKELLAALSPEQAAALKALDPAKVTASPELVEYIAALLITLDAYLGWAGIVNSYFSEDVLLMWRMTSFMVALLLAFRVNRVYLRWCAALQAFGGIGTAAVTLAQQAVLWVHDPLLQAELLAWCGVWQYSVQHVCARAQRLHKRGAALLTEGQLAYYHSHPKPRQLVVLQLRQLITLALDPVRDYALFQQMNDTLNKGSADMGTCGRTFFYAMPWALSAICTCFLQTWLILMPAATSVNSHPAAAAAAAAGAGSAAAYRLAPKLAVDMMLYSLACAMLLGVDEVAAQLEQPFPFVPMIDMADATLRAVERAPTETRRMADLMPQRAADPGPDAAVAAAALPLPATLISASSKDERHLQRVSVYVHSS
ncbi:hypothetical protein MNEG_6138 [Monoraphidium neglectum]|uniref:Uncharacterized protein n=1 Tax=Monoraphidium neglectum TaxID=145388 RepID=A0A0D2MFA6_9CHLO|nr:hypothetical protein MNEG_6138 [Monoraphidium neglectum]KIZ01825.1 hypothetical protein MNEG_6138 [Monoraphidium neglectum]|eukprot:XP_013900844.1 hypothetical protein MNEG_6138 [Monoraphidium neglectum]